MFAPPIASVASTAWAIDLALDFRERDRRCNSLYRRLAAAVHADGGLLLAQLGQSKTLEEGQGVYIVFAESDGD